MCDDELRTLQAAPDLMKIGQAYRGVGARDPNCL